MSQIPDFFISYTGADAAWAEWIAVELEKADYKTVIQLWDFAPGSNFVFEMKKAAADPARTIAVLSARYLKSEFAQAEWAAAFVADRDGEQRKLVPVRIEEFPLIGIDATITYIDLAGLDEDTARSALLRGLETDREKRKGKGRFPGKAEGASRPYPGQMPPLFRLPQRNRNFTGREALLNDLRTSLAAGGSAALTGATRQAAAHGLGGAGKSQVAIEYAWRWASDYSRIVWVRAETPEALAADFDALADDLGLFNGDKPSEQATVIAAVCEHLSRNPGWLLIFDNAPAPQAVERAVPRVGGHVIFTSRYGAWGKHAAPLRVDVWPLEEAEEFLLRRVEGSECGEARGLAEDLGRLPLALEHAAAYCEQRGLRLAEYRDRFRKHGLKLFDAKRLGEDDVATVTTTWSLSFEAVREKSPDAADLLELAAFFAPDRFPLDVLVAQKFIDELALDDAVAELLKYSLVMVEGGPGERALSVHRLVQEVTRARMGEDERVRWVEAALRIVNAAFPFESDDVRAWPACGRLAPHAIAVLEHAEPRQEIDRRRTARLFNQLAGYAVGRAEYGIAESFFKRAVAICESALGPDHPHTASSLNNLALLYCNQGRYQEAEPLFQRALTIFEKALGQEHPETAKSLNNLAALYRNQGRYQEAEPLFQRALSIREKALGPDHPETAASLNNFAELCTTLGRYEQAELLHQRALTICGKALGPDHPNTATSINNLALLYYKQGRYEDAEPLFQRGLTICEKVLGPDHPDTATSLNNLAGLYHNQGRYEEAEPLFQRALTIYEKALGPDHPDTARSRANYAGLLLDRPRCRSGHAGGQGQKD